MDSILITEYKLNLKFVTKQQYFSLFEKHLSGTASPEEEQILIEFQDQFDLERYPWNDQTMGEKKKVKARLQRKLADSIPQLSSVRSIRIKRWAIAASLLITFLMSFFYMVYHKNTDQEQQERFALKRILPGSNKATLTLADGTTIALGDEVQKEEISQGSTIILARDKGLLVYQEMESDNDAKSEPLFNTISTPRGGQYQVVLPDGTKVWLNASSSLSFPARFTGQERNVQLKGEAYFEVAKRKDMPFRVEVNEMTVKVLGTHFNVMAYDDEQSIHTTLLEGAVEVKNLFQKKILKAGQQANLKRNTGIISVEDAKGVESIAWKDGNFTFTDDSIQMIMRQISRWYDVDIKYVGDLSDKFFEGSIARHEQVSEVLKMLELTGTIHFKIEGRRITVMP